MDRGLLVQLDITSSTQASRRNEAQKYCSYDISENVNFVENQFILARNNAELSNPLSERRIEKIESFLYVYSPYEISITIGKGAQQFVFPSQNIFVFSSALDFVLLRNMRIEHHVLIEVVLT